MSLASFARRALSRFTRSRGHSTPTSTPGHKRTSNASPKAAAAKQAVREVSKATKGR